MWRVIAVLSGVSYPRPVKRLVPTIVMVTVGLLAAACSTNPQATVPGSSHPGGATTPPSSSRLLAFTRCMRAHGVPNFPPPGHTGFPKHTLTRISASNPRYDTATQKCAHILPGGTTSSSSKIQQIREQGLRFARCMRHHGVDLPDPASTGRIPTPTSVGLNQGSPAFEAGNQACGRWRPPYMPSNAAYNAWAKTHGS
jgi:hypothetical protein